jgi:uncharacterized metal-binding protein YceD (DUF177 family)
MKFSRSELRRYRTIEFDEVVSYAKEKIVNKPSLLDIKNVHALAKVELFNDLIKADIEATATLVLECAYTLEPLERNITINETLQLTEDVREDDALLYAPGPEINLDDYLYGLILTEVPAKVVKRGAHLPKEGKGYRVITEDQLIREKEQNGDPRLNELDKFEE